MSKKYFGLGLCLVGLMSSGLLAMGCAATEETDGVVEGEKTATVESALEVNPCTDLCVTNIGSGGSFKVPYTNSYLGTYTACYYTYDKINGGNCHDVVSPRKLMVNGVAVSCNGSNWPTLPAKRNGGYCISTTMGNQAYAGFTVW
jgi:hypothetical protein